MYASYEFYTGTFLGTAITAADFPRLCSRASDFVDYFTRGKAEKATDERVVNAIKKACCALAEQIQLDENSRAIENKTQGMALDADTGEVKSESVGSWSVSYVTAADYAGQNAAEIARAASVAYASIAARYLTHTGLLYRGGCC